MAWFLQPPTQLGAVIGLVADERCDALPVAMSHSEPGQSSASPPVRRMARRRPRASAGTFVLRPAAFPPFPPAAERCALTCGESIIQVLADLPFPASSRNKFSQTPRRARRINRLQIVVGGPQAGQSHPRQPLFNPCPMPPMTRRSIPAQHRRHPSASKAQIRFHCLSLGQNTFLLTISIPSRQTITILIVGAERFMSSDPVHKLREKLGAPNYPPLPVLLWPVAFPSRFLTDRRRP